MWKSLFWLAVLVSCAAPWCVAQLTPPRTQTEPVTDTLHGVKITDPYRWLEDQNSPATREWLAAQDKFARAYLDTIPGRDALHKKFEALLKIDTMGVPSVRHDRYFFSRRMAGEDRASLILRDGLTGKDEVLVDPKTATDDPTTSVQYLDLSDDGGLIAFGARRGGEDEVSVRLLNVDTRKFLSDSLPRGRYFGFSIKPDKTGFFYSRFTVGQGSRVYYHAMGTPSAADPEIFGKGYGPTQLVGAGVTENGRWLLIEVSEGVPAKRTELHFQDLRARTPIRTLLKEDAEFAMAEAGDTLFLTTNWKAPNRRVIRLDLNSPAAENWKDVVPESPLAIESSAAVGGRLFVRYLDNVITHVKQFDIAGKPLGDLKLPGIGTAAGPYGRWRDDQAFFTFTSFVTPSTSYRFQVSTGKQDVWFRPTVPVRSEDFETKQVWYGSKDGTKIPMFLVHRKGITPDGNLPVLLNAYGGFNVSLTPNFSSQAVAWAQLGGVYAVANLRGGGEFGESWHRAGMFEHKQNVFDDFIGAAEWLVANHYTKPARLGIIGGSNGGLLMGAMMTQRPDLFGAIVCGAPLLDMLRYHNMSVGGWWASEYGSADDPKQFAYLRKYSPYHNVKKGAAYPAIMFVTGDADTRVDPAHARKMAALVQFANTSANPILLRYDTKGGHSGIGSVTKTIDEQVDQIAFLAGRLSLKLE
ncbi:MAG: prolyl oligopeptidase [Candidatus Solibacter sp.]|nr:prolyl oligopeptidase [Candidatus Solibacter sp.]